MQVTRSILCLLSLTVTLHSPAFADDASQACDKMLQKTVGNSAKYSATPAIAEALGTVDFARKTGISFTSYDSLLANDKITNRLLGDYIQAQESYHPDPLANYGNFDVVRVFSDPVVLAKYQSRINPSNPDSPAKKLGAYGQRMVQVEDIKLLNTLPVAGEAAHAYSVTASVEEQTPGGSRSYETVILLALKYTHLSLSDRDTCLNPFGFRVFSYDNSGGR